VVDRPRGIKTAPLGVGAKTKADIPRIGLTMFLAIAAVLVILWALGFIVFHVAGALIHLLIALALIAVIVHFVMGRKTAGA
jgi:4-hydroxybenzoate polyprenyltransferase